MFILAYSFG